MKIADRLYISTIDENAAALAEADGLGLELAEFCTAANLDENLPEWLPVVRERMRHARRFVFHAPFAELYPAAIDPRARRLALDRLNQAWERMADLGVKRMVAHSGFLPRVYFPQWHVPRSVEFWREFLSDKPEDFSLLIENVLDDTPELLRDILRELEDPRAGACLDIGHAHVASCVPLSRWIGELRPWLKHAHLHDNDGSFDQHLPLGAGTIPWAELLPALPEDCTLTLENMEAAESIRWLREKGWMECGKKGP